MDRQQDQADVVYPHDIVGQSQAMLQAAQAGNWEDVDGLERQRHASIQKLFAQNPLDAAPDDIIVAIQHIQDIDKEIAALAIAEKKSVLEQLKAFKNSRQAHKAYLQHR